MPVLPLKQFFIRTSSGQVVGAMAFLIEEKHGVKDIQLPRAHRSSSLQRVVAILILVCMTVIAGLQWHQRFQYMAGSSVKPTEASKDFRWEDVRS